MIIKYFSWVRDIAEIAEEELNLPNDVQNVNQLIVYLINKEEKYKKIFLKKNLIKIAVNQVYAKSSTKIKNTDEIAFFPPVTGG